MKLNKKHKNISGIYCIKNFLTNKVYVGKSKNIYNRIREHIWRLSNNKSDSPKLQEEWLRDGKEVFDYFILDLCDIEPDMSKRELYWSEKLESLCPSKGYNLRSDGDSGMIVHEETSIKISNRLKKEWASGIRSQHSSKLTENWKNNSKRRIEQSQIMTKTLTRYVYIVDGKLFSYADLKDAGLKNVIASFHKKKTNTIIFKGKIIIKQLI
jgi:group I intron endonuclease